jgi:hypothetical protein
MLNAKVEFYHDLESYFWLAYLITCNCAGPFNMRRDWDGEIKLSATHKTITPSSITGLAEIKTYRKILDVDRSTSSDVQEPITPLYSQWVRPGVHSLSLMEIVQQRNSVSDTDFANLMTPYFIRHKIVREGMLELRSLFWSPETQSPDNYVRRNTIAPPTMYERVLSILHHIRDGIDPAKDQYPQDQELEYARARYRRYLETGNRMPLLVDDNDFEGRIVSKRKAQSDARSIDGSTKRARGPGASEAGFGAPARRGTASGTWASGKSKMKAIA